MITYPIIVRKRYFSYVILVNAIKHYFQFLIITHDKGVYIKKRISFLVVIGIALILFAGILGCAQKMDIKVKGEAVTGFGIGKRAIAK